MPFGGAAPDETTYFHYGVHETNKLLHFDPIEPKNGYSNDQETLRFIDKPCFAFDSSTTATCQTIPPFSKFVDTKPRLFNYPKPWFWITSLTSFILPENIAFLGSRMSAMLLNLCALFIGALFWRREGERLFLGLLLALTPLAFSVIFSYNPNGFEISTITGINLLLYGKAKYDEEKVTKKLWWLSFAALGICATIAKPMSGFLLLYTLLLYVLYSWVREKSESSSLDTQRTRIQILLLGVIFAAISTYQSLDALTVGQSYVNTLDLPSTRSILSKTLLSTDSYFLQNAGIFGWMDTPPAPWLLVFWVGIFFIVLFNAYSASSCNIKLLLLSVWTFTLFVLPPFAAAMYSRGAGGGLQTRYLSSIFAVTCLLTVCSLREKNLKMLRKIPLFLFGILIINFYWILLRYVVGIPEIYASPKLLFTGLFISQSWHPTYFNLSLLSLATFMVLLRNFAATQKMSKLLMGVLASLFFIASLFFTFNSHSFARVNTEVVSNTPGVPAGEIYDFNIFTQSIVPEQNNFSGFRIMFATYAKKNIGTINVELLDATGKQLFAQKLKMSDIADNSYRQFNFPPILNSGNKMYSVRIFSQDAEVGNAVTVWTSPNDVYEKGSAKIGQDALNGDLVMSLLYTLA